MERDLRFAEFCGHGNRLIETPGGGRKSKCHGPDNGPSVIQNEDVHLFEKLAIPAGKKDGWHNAEAWTLPACFCCLFRFMFESEGVIYNTGIARPRKTRRPHLVTFTGVVHDGQNKTIDPNL